MSFPSSPPALPAIVARFAVGRPVRAVWVNELGGVTFRVDSGMGAGCEFIKVARRGTADFANEARRTPSRLQAVQRLDALANSTDVKVADVQAVIAEHTGARGLVRLRAVLPLIDGGAESPQETWTRLVLIDAGLPKPQTQIRVFDDYGDFVARIDLGYEQLRVGVEYDGPQHWTDPAQRARDIERSTALLDLGWTIIRVTSELLWYRRGTFVGRVDAAMRAAGWRP